MNTEKAKKSKRRKYDADYKAEVLKMLASGQNAPPPVRFRQPGLVLRHHLFAHARGRIQLFVFMDRLVFKENSDGYLMG
jgi:hypothetical protein